MWKPFTGLIFLERLSDLHHTGESLSFCAPVSYTLHTYYKRRVRWVLECVRWDVPIITKSHVCTNVSGGAISRSWQIAPLMWVRQAVAHGGLPWKPNTTCFKCDRKPPVLCLLKGFLCLSAWRVCLHSQGNSSFWITTICRLLCRRQGSRLVLPCSLTITTNCFPVKKSQAVSHRLCI